jgi:hypothetical protein
MRFVRTAAWTVFLLDLVVLGQLGYWLLTASDPLGRNILYGVTLMLGSGLAGILVVLVASACTLSRAGYWVALVCGAVPLLWVLAAIWQSMWQ